MAVPAMQADEAVAALRQAGIEINRRVGSVEPYDGRSRIVFA